MIILGSWFFSLVLNIPQFFKVTHVKGNIPCLYPEQWMLKATLMTWLSFNFISSALMIGLYSRVAHTLWFKRHDHNVQSCQQQVISTFQVASCSQALNETVHLNSLQKTKTLRLNDRLMLPVPSCLARWGQNAKSVTEGSARGSPLALPSAALLSWTERMRNDWGRVRA